jgi:hypothetical protein
MPSNFADYQREYMRQYRARGADKSTRRSARLTREFIGVDGEGGNFDDSGYHAYFLLTVGEESIVPSPGNARLTTWECLDFLSRLDPHKEYVSYFFDYDVTKILEDLSWERLTRLMDRSKRAKMEGRGLFPVAYREFEIDYLPRKEFKVRRKVDTIALAEDTTEDIWGPWVVISDVGSFFQCKFLDALKLWNVGTQEQWEAIERGKDGRASFSFKNVDDISEYNSLEIELLQQLMGRFRDACEDAGYIPARWQGPGLLAEAMFKAHGVPRSKDVGLLGDDRYRGLIEFASNAFYGGRPEITAVGPCNRPIFQWDINSAYPYAMKFVPCLKHGEWEHVQYESGVSVVTGSANLPDASLGEVYALHFGTFTDKLHGDHPEDSPHTKRPILYGLPVRTHEGTITYPAAGQGWYWSFEIEASIHQSFKVEESWIYRRTCNCKPLSFVDAVYQARRAMGKDGPGIVLKLGLNSLYGKTVQSIGTPKYANPIWGSFITAYCRSMIQKFIHASPMCRDDIQCGKDVLMIATDSVCTWTDRTDIIESKDLGGWSKETHHSGMFIVQPGLYFGSSGKRAKTRGVPLAVIESKEGDFRAAFSRMVETRRLVDGDVRVPQTMFVGIRYALHRHNLKLLGQWVSFVDPETGAEGKVIRFDWSSKRARHPALAPLPGVHDNIETFPLEGDASICTHPYSKDIGGLRLRDALRLAFADQPDWQAGFIGEEVNDAA